MDGIANPWPDDQNSLSSIPQYHQYSGFDPPQPGSTTKYGSHRRLSMTKKLATGIPMDSVAIPWSNDENSLSSIPQYHKNKRFGHPCSRDPQPRSTPKKRCHKGLCMTKNVYTGVPTDGVASPRRSIANMKSGILQYHQYSDLGLSPPAQWHHQIPLPYTSLQVERALPGVVMDGVVVRSQSVQNFTPQWRIFKVAVGAAKFRMASVYTGFVFLRRFFSVYTTGGGV